MDLDERSASPEVLLVYYSSNARCELELILQLAIGLPLLLGIGVRIAGSIGVAMLLLMYTAGFLLPENNPFLDEHLIFAVIMIGLVMAKSGRHLGLGGWWADTKIVRRAPILE